MRIPGDLSAIGKISAVGGVDVSGSFLSFSKNNDGTNDRITYSSSINGLRFSAGDGFEWFNVRNNRVNMSLAPNGDLAIQGNYGQLSDARYKTDVRTFGGALDTVRRLRGVTFNWKPELNKHSDRQIGFIAQEVEAVLPELVTTDREGYKRIAYSNAEPVLVEAVKEQQAQIERQRKQIEDLKRIVCALKTDAEVCKEEK